MSATDQQINDMRENDNHHIDLNSNIFGTPSLATPEGVTAYDRVMKGSYSYQAITEKLDDIVEEKEKKQKKSDNKSEKDKGKGGSSEFKETDPWLEPVSGIELAREIESTLNKYLVLPEHAATAIALWILLTYTYDRFDCCPILAIVSPEKRCGKTTLLALLISLCEKVLSASNITPAATFRAIEKWHPTLVVDEADTFLRQNDELRGILNSGHTRATAFVTRAVQKGKDYDVQRFSTWTPKSIALIGKLPDTLADRSIMVKMRRKRGDEVRDRVRYSRLTNELEGLRRKIKRWSIDTTLHDNAAAPNKLDDRAADNWLPLLSIANKIGWSEKANNAAIVLSGKTDTDTIRTELLEDINEILSSDTDRDSIPSKALLLKLNNLEERPWSTYHRGKELSGRGLASLLKPFGINSSLIRFPDGPARGYEKEAFTDAFTRYLSVTSVTSLQDKGLQDNLSVTRNEYVTDRNLRNQLGDNNVTDVTHKNGVAKPNEIIFEDTAPF